MTDAAPTGPEQKPAKAKRSAKKTTTDSPGATNSPGTSAADTKAAGKKATGTKAATKKVSTKKVSTKKVTAKKSSKKTATGETGAGGETDTSATAGGIRPLPEIRPSRVVVEAVRPAVDGGTFAAKAAIDRPVVVLADVFCDGHDLVEAALLVRPAEAGDGEWIEIPMEPLGNDRHRASFVPDRLGPWDYDVIGWMSHGETWRQGMVKKLAAGLDVAVDLEIGRLKIAAMLEHPEPGARAVDLDRLRALADDLGDKDASALDDNSWRAVFHRCEPRTPIARLPRPLRIDVDPLVASVGAWYSFFPRSTTSTAADRGDESARRPGTLRDAIDRLEYISSMGFDVAYIPPVHPIGITNRKGKNNSTVAEPDDVGSPYAIGSADGGHVAVAPELGTIDDFRDLVTACRERGMHLALDIAFNCSPDHPWVTEHPDWFTRRPDGSIQYAENPPKKYEDIYPLDFETDDWQNLWIALADVFRFWIDNGVTVFRVDNPHTKSFAFWEWALATLRRERPDVVFLSEAFTRPRVMERLAKIGFNQSYTYFAWRHSSWDLRTYFTELSTRTADYFRPTAWPNTHDILTTQVQTGGRAGFVMRTILAATLAPSWGIYGPAYELLETRPREGVEDYADSEKYQIRHWELDHPDSLAPLVTRLNAIRREHPALTNLDTIRFHNTDNEALLCFTKIDPAGVGDPMLVVVNVDPHHVQAGHIDVDLAAIDLPYGSTFDVVDRLGGETYRWTGNYHFVELSPWGAMAHVFTVHPVVPLDDVPLAEGTG